MNPFKYITAHSLDEAISLIGKNGRYLAGGTDLLGEMKDYIVSPDVLVNVKDVDHQVVNKIEIFGPLVKGSTEQFYSLLGRVTIAEITTNQNLKKDIPGLVDAASEVGSPQIRNVATLAGNLLQHSRCWYYRQPDIVCLKRGGDMCHAQNGENKYHSLFTGCSCVSPVVSNLAVILTVLEATANILRAGKPETMTMAELYHEAWKNPAAHHSLDPQDFLVSVHFPLKRTRSAYRQVSEKSEFDWALVSCAAAGNVTDGKITNARVALGAVAPVPYMVEEAHHYLEGKPLTDEHASKAADIILKDAKPLEHNGYKVPLAHALIRRTLLALNP
jgi:xanthine dehydrogenase YagS FAD-binding subunit